RNINFNIKEKKRDDRLREDTFGEAPSNVANDYTKYYREELLSCWELKFHESNIQRHLKGRKIRK
ncbi:hypothetical protein Anas_11149, partial [Armadillidium nasatum]